MAQAAQTQLGAQLGAQEQLDRAVRIAKLALLFGRTERITRHEDGVRPETDTDHTVMLGLVACELAPPGLNRDTIAAFVLVHDLPEAYAGDTQTLIITPAERAAKEAREEAAMQRLLHEHDRPNGSGGPGWLWTMLQRYEDQHEPEARFVKLMDKVVPKLTHLCNGCVAAKAKTDRAGFAAAHTAQLATLQDRYGDEFPETLALLEAAMHAALAAWVS